MAGVSRRTFMKGASVALAASALAASGSRKVSANDKIVIGAIGCGGIGKVNLQTFLHHADVDCAVVCDVDERHLAQGAQIVEGARDHAPTMERDFRRVIERNDIDAVLVSTPDHWHALPTIYACQAGQDVYCEKPLGKSIDEGRAMLDAQKANNTVAQMGTHWRSDPHIAQAVKFIQDGKAGKIRFVRAWSYLDWIGGIGNPPDGTPPAEADYDLWLGPAPDRPFNENRFHFNFRWFWDYAGGLMTDWGVHLLNICQWAMGPEVPKRVSSTGGKYVVEDNSETPDTQVALYEFSDYTLVFEQQMVGGIGPGGKPHGMLFSGSEGTVIITESSWEYIPEPTKGGQESVEESFRNDPRRDHVRNFLDCVKTREDPAQNFEISHFVSTMALLGNLAYRTGAEVHWDAENERVTNNLEADALVACAYRDPWTLPYSHRLG